MAACVTAPPACMQDAGGVPFTDAELQERFDALAAAGVRAVGIWKSPIPANWFPFLRAMQGQRDPEQ